MSVPNLVVFPSEPAERSPAARATQLFAEARAAALEQVRAVEESLRKVIVLAGEISGGGDIYPVGVRDLCRRLAEDLAARAATLDSLANRNMDAR